MRRILFRRPVPLSEGFARAESIIKAAGRPLTAFCACELRSPGQFSEDGFKRFNELYVNTLSLWGIFDGSTNPVARSNVCPEVNGPSEPSFHAFTFTVERDEPRPSFVIAGSAECPEGLGNYRDNIVRLGDLSQEAILEKARFVLGEMERRLGVLGAGWAGVTATQVYTVHNIHPFLASELVARGPLRPELLGIMTARLLSISSTKWIAAVYMRSWSTEPSFKDSGRRLRPHLSADGRVSWH